MRRNGMVKALVGAAALLLTTAWSASAQITTGTVSGNVTDPQGVVPGATVMLISQAQGTKLGPQVTDKDGNYVFAYVAADIYTVSVELQGYKTATRKDVHVVGGDRVAVPTIQIQPGQVTESVDVKADTAILQAASGERSDVVQTQQLESLPVANRGFRDLVNLLPGVSPSGGGRIGGGGQDNIMIDGISIMDTGNNGLMGGPSGNNLNIPVDQVSEVRLETSGYQAEFGRSSGLQVSAVTKSGTNRFHGSLYEISNNSKWNQNSWTNIQNGVAKSRSKSNSYGFTFGGPVGKPGGNNKLFFFAAEQFNPTLGGNSTTQLRVPTPEERQGIFTYSLDQQGKLLLTGGKGLYDSTLGAKSGCTSSVATTCFPNGVIPISRLYGPMVALMNLYPMPTCGMGEPSGAALPACASGQSFNYQNTTPVTHNLAYVPTIRGDYQVTPGLRVSAKVTDASARPVVNLGSIPGITDSLAKFTNTWDVSGTVNYSLNPTTFLEATYGFNQNRLGSPPIAAASDRRNVTCANDIAAGTWGGLNAAAIPNCTLDQVSYPLKGGPGQTPITMDKRYYEFNGNLESGTPWLDPNTGVMTMWPSISYGAASGTTSRYANVVPSPNFPGFMNINRSQLFTASVTKVIGRHTAKAGFYFEHSYKAQNQGAGGSAPSFQGSLNFGNDSNNPLDTGFPLANQILGVFQTYGQASNFVEGSFVYYSAEPYIQDNWKVTRKLTLDYGLRFVHQGPQYDQYGQVANFFENQWSLSAAPKLYQPGCAGASPCSGTNRQAKDPTTGLLLGPGTAGLIGAAVLNSGNFANGMVQADGKAGNIPISGYLWPGLVFAPRFGLAYDLMGNQKVILRGNIGTFYDRPNGNTVFSTVTNPPLASTITNQWGTLASGAGAVASGPVSTITVFQYNAKQPTDTQWSAGMQMALPWSSSVGVAYVGHHSFNTLGNVNLNAIDLCTAFSAAQGCSQAGSAFANTGLDPTQAAATPKPDNLLRGFQGFAAINRNSTIFWRTFHSIQSDFTRRFRNGVSFGVAWTLSLKDTSNSVGIGGNPVVRLVHAADGSYTTASTQAQAQALFGDQGITRHIIQTNFVWAVPKMSSDNNVGRVLAAVVNDWQLSGIFRVDSGAPYDLSTPTYAGGGGNVNLTGSSDYGARILINNLGAMGSGCSSNQYSQFTNNFSGTNFVLGSTTPIAGPTVGSLGLESGRNLFHACANRTLDLSLSRTIRLGGGRQIQLRADAFNAPNAVIWNNRNATVNLTSPTNQTVTNSQILADGTVDTTKLKPNQAGFGAVSGAAAARTVQLQIRFIF